MSMATVYFEIFILFCYSFSLIELQLSPMRNLECVQPVLRIDNGGLIQSHRQFGMTLYPNNLDCDWLILAPFGYQILIQFNFLNIEADQSCQYDYIEFVISSNQSRKICGTDDSKRLLSTERQLTVRFHSDESTFFEGFQFRYLFVSSATVNLGSISVIKDNRACADDEWKCNFASSCIPKNCLCDNVRDCRDNSDEIGCVSIRPCHQSQLSCANHQCIPKEFWCNGIFDCEDRSDETHCNSTIALPDPFKPAIRNECSFQSISPNYINNDDDNSQIVGGHEAIPGSWPWMISLRYGNSHMCGATLLSDRWAVTAGHCFIMDSNPYNWTVHLGQHYLYSGHFENAEVESIIVHPKFNIGLVDYDISLIKFKKKITFSASVQSICLPEQMKEPKPGRKCVILGWGYTKGTGVEGVLNQAIIPIVARTTCMKEYKGMITPEMICAGYETGGVDACSGDSGGPLVCQNEGKFILYGISSWGEDCALPNRAGVYTNIANFVHWINENIEEKEPTSATLPTLQSTISIKPSVSSKKISLKSTRLQPASGISPKSIFTFPTSKSTTMKRSKRVHKYYQLI